MKTVRHLAAGGLILVLTAAAFVATDAPAREIYYPSIAGAAPIPPGSALRHVGAYDAPYRAPRGTRSGRWIDVSTPIPFESGPSAPMLLSDGTVLIDDYCTSPDPWYKLTPDKKGG